MRAGSRVIFSCSMSLRVPAVTRRPSTYPLTPWPAMASNWEGAKIGSLFSVAAFIRAMPMGCSDWLSREAARERRDASSRLPELTTSVTAKAPSVRVPVLSKTMVSTFSPISRASAFLTRMPFFAARVVEMAVTVGMASPRAWGQAMTRTVTAMVRAKTRPTPATLFQ